MDAGLHAHTLILKTADFAGSLDGTGPIYSELEARYNRIVSILIERDKTSPLNVIKRFQLDREIKRESQEVYRLSRRLKDSKILSLATALVKGGGTSGGSSPGGNDTMSKILKYGAIAGGVIAIVGGIWKMTQGSRSASASAPARISAPSPSLAPSAAPSAPPVGTFAAPPVEGGAAERLRALQQRFSLEAGKSDPDPAVLRDLRLEMESVRGK